MALGQAILVASDQLLVFCGRASDPALAQMLIEDYRSWDQKQPNDPVYSFSLPRFEPGASQHHLSLLVQPFSLEHFVLRPLPS